MPGSVSVLIPQGLHSITFGYSVTPSPADGGSADAYCSYYASSDITASLLYNLGPNAIAIGGRQLIVDTSADPYRREAFKHKSLSAQRQSINLNNISGEGTVNTEGLWRRGQSSWVGGAGQKYLDRNNTADETRFYKSKGLDMFNTPFQATLLNDTKQIKATTNTNLALIRCGSYMYLIDGNTVYECADTSAATPVWNAMTFNTSGAYTAPSSFYSIDANDSYVFVATNTGVFYYQAGATGGNQRVFYGWAKNPTGTTFTGYNMVRWCNDRIVASSGSTLYCFDPGHITTGGGVYPATGPAPATNDLLMAMTSNPSWIWTDACPGQTVIYFIGYSAPNTNAYNGALFKSSIQAATTGTPSLYVQYPTQALPLSPDEYPTVIKTYLNYVFIGTNKGVRMAQADSSGNLTSGPIMPNQLQPVSSPVRAITGNGRFVWFGWSNYDTSSTGLGKLDLSRFTDALNLTPAYQSDLMVSGSGEILSMTWDYKLNSQVFAVSGKGLYATDFTKYVTVGSIYSGGFTYGIPDHKIPVFFDYGVDMPDTTSGTAPYVVADLEVEPFDASQKKVVPIPEATEGTSRQRITSGSSYSSETFQAVTSVHSPSQTTSPILYRWTLEAWPTVVSETQIIVPVQAMIVNVVDGMETYADPYEIFMYLENLRVNQTIVLYQEGTLTADVVVNSLDWQPHKRQGNYENGYEGNIVVTMQTIGGYNPYPGSPTQ